MVTGSFGSRKLVAGILSVLFTLSGCGGGGGSSTGSGTTPTATITQENAATLAATAIVGSEAVYTSSSAGNDTTAKATVSNANTRRFNLADFSRMMLGEIEHSAGGQVSGKAAPKTGVCSSGSADVGYTDTDGNGQQSIGDTFTATFISCNIEGAVINGSMSITLTNVSIGGGSSSMSATINLSSFTVSEGGNTVSMNGGYSFSSTVSLSPMQATIHLSSSSLTVAVNSTSTTLSDFSMTATVNNSSYSYQTSGAISSTGLGGIIVFQTTTPFVGPVGSGDGFPTSGSLKVTGANNASVTITVSGTVVNVAADINGDGTNDFSTNTTWDALTSGV
ncbi:MAG: hypothetical protein HZA20_06365 [Nitrospirae bacterium]|nr:hypothetical protein [Nitrospirota bacterium]